MQNKLIASVCAAAFVFASALSAAPHETSTDPLPNTERAVVAINAFSTGPWVRGDWALKCYLLTGHGSARVEIPMEIVGGWRPEIGRWQRIRLPNARQWIIKDVPVTEVAPAKFSPKLADKPDPFGAALIPESNLSTKSNSGDVTDSRDLSASSNNLSRDSQKPAISTLPPKPQEGGISLTPVSAPSSSNSSSQENKPLELVYNGQSLETSGVSIEKEEAAKPEDAPVLSPKDPHSRMTSGVWEILPSGKTHFLSAEERLNGINERIPMSWELYTMSFLNLPQIKYKGVEKVRARWCDKVELIGDEEYGPYTKAEVWLDTEFGAPLEADLYDGRGNLAKIVRAVSIQRVKVTRDGTSQNEWILKEWEVVDAESHAKVTIDVAAVSLGRDWPNKLFDEKDASLRDWPDTRNGEWKDIE